MVDETILQVMKLASHYDVKDCIGWDVDDNGNLIIFAICNNFFMSNTIDNQLITSDTIIDWQKAIVDVIDVDPAARKHGCLLYCCRRRSMRPQGAAYDSIPTALWPLFDECGTERSVGLWNPRKHPHQRDNNGVVECLAS